MPWAGISYANVGGLLLDLTRLSVSELKFLVDSPLALRELGYAQQIRLRNAGHLKALYPQLKYERSRLARKSYTWPHGAYRLIDIGKKGGIKNERWSE